MNARRGIALWLMILVLTFSLNAYAGQPDQSDVLVMSQLVGQELFVITRKGQDAVLQLYRYQDGTLEHVLTNDTVFVQGSDSYGIVLSQDGKIVTYSASDEAWKSIMTWERSEDQTWRLVFYADPDPFYQVAVSGEELDFYDELLLESKVTAVPNSVDTELSAFDFAAFAQILAQYPSRAYEDE